ncbi:hypothetical protein [Flavobacterium poyangense]|uniref:hypothetical protein n=1 Tax=Flavobacterium poyangense TaxID=2204302 RepID=UPI00141E0813|nr:hypothetical protein [Flavobacterium sp. JXAS1]
MPNNTEEDYKEAVRIKYEKEIEGIYSNYLRSPSQANLRDLCWKIFKSNEKKDDLQVYFDFCKFEFDPKHDNTSTIYTDKFKKVGDFLKREKEPAKIDTVDLAAILVDYQPRPFIKFRKIGSLQSELEKEGDGKEEEGNEARGNQIMGKTSFGENDGRTFDNGGGKNVIVTTNTKSVSFKRLFEKLFKRSESTMLAITIIFCLIAAVIYFAFIRKECMQWTGDHYEKVDCDLKITGFGAFNKIVAFDETEFFRQKIEVCDTTTYFKEGQPIIWYVKNNNKVDFFNMLGIHPENGKTLRPVTDHIFNKYKEDCQPKAQSK